MADLARIKSNVAKMAAQNAPEEDIDGYIASEGVTIDDVRNFKPGEKAPIHAEPGPGQEGFGELTPYEPSFLESVGNRLYDAANAMGLPASQMRRDLQGVDAFVRGAADVPTFGLADEISARAGAVTGVGGERGNYEGNLELQRAIDEQDEITNPGARFAGQVAGSVVLPAGRARTALGAGAEGAALAGLYGFGSGEGGAEDRLVNAGKSAIAGFGVGSTFRKVANTLGNRAAAKTIQSNEQIRKQAETAYNKAEAAGVIFKPEGVKQLAHQIVADLADFGFDPALQPGVAAVIRRFQGLDGQNVTLKGLDVVRRVANNAAKVKDNPSQQEISRRIVDRIDDYIENVTEADVLMGNAKQGAAAMREAREAWGRFRRSQMVDTATARADLRAASTGSGGNADNATRQNVRRLIERPGLKPNERAAAERVVRGTPTQNALRLAGKLAPTGVVSGVLSGGAGYGLAGPLGIALPLAGAGAKALADRMTIKNVERLSQIIRSGGQTAKDLGNLARGGQLDVPGVKRIENVAKALGMRVSELAAALREYAIAR